MDEYLNIMDSLMVITVKDVYFSHKMSKIARQNNILCFDGINPIIIKMSRLGVK